MDQKLVKEIAEAIVKFNNGIPQEEYMGHGELHFYQPKITVDQVADIINIKCNKGKSFKAWAIFKYKGENHIVLEFDHENRIVLCTKWLHPVDEQHIRAIAKKLEHTLVLKVDEIKDILYIW